jgi:hypothetical protein
MPGTIKLAEPLHVAVESTAPVAKPKQSIDPAAALAEGFPDRLPPFTRVRAPSDRFSRSVPHATDFAQVAPLAVRFADFIFVLIPGFARVLGPSNEGLVFDTVLAVSVLFEPLPKHCALAEALPIVLPVFGGPILIAKSISETLAILKVLPKVDPLAFGVSVATTLNDLALEGQEGGVEAGQLRAGLGILIALVFEGRAAGEGW